MLCVWGACVYLLVGCGSSTTDFFDAPGAARMTVSASGSASNAGTGNSTAHAGESSGGSSSGPGPGSGGNPSTTGDSDAPCHPAKDISGGMSGPFGSVGPECLRVSGMIAGWGCSNFDGRSVKVNGQTVMCGQLPLPDPIDGAYYFDVSAGTFDYASFYWY